MLLLFLATTCAAQFFGGLFPQPTMQSTAAVQSSAAAPSASPSSSASAAASVVASSVPPVIITRQPLTVTVLESPEATAATTGTSDGGQSTSGMPSSTIIVVLVSVLVVAVAAIWAFRTFATRPSKEFKYRLDDVHMHNPLPPAIGSNAVLVANAQPFVPGAFSKPYQEPFSQEYSSVRPTQLGLSNLGPAEPASVYYPNVVLNPKDTYQDPASLQRYPEDINYAYYHDSYPAHYEEYPVYDPNYYNPNHVEQYGFGQYSKNLEESKRATDGSNNTSKVVLPGEYPIQEKAVPTNLNDKQQATAISIGDTIKEDVDEPPTAVGVVKPDDRVEENIGETHAPQPEADA